jgi:asparagine synthase (glutamine-hydrolysing)
LGAIAGVFGSCDNPRRVVQDLLFALRHRGAKTSIAATEEEGAGWAIGCSSNDDLASHFLRSTRGALALDGSFFERQNGVKFAHRRVVKGSVREGAANLLFEPGEFAVLGNLRDRIFAFRDPNGLKPLYYAASPEYAAFASERKALWTIGLRKVKRVLPGHLHSVSKRGTTETRLMRIKHLQGKPMTFEQATSQLARLLKQSVRRVTKRINRVAVAFSGGLDSAVTAALAKTASQVELVTVGLSGSSELSTVEKYARELDLPVCVEAFEQDSLENYVRRVVWLIEEPNLMKVSVAVPLHWAAMLAARRGFTVMLCGQGSDELYGGYYKYAKTLDAKGRRALVNELYRSVIEASQVNYERDEQATAPFGVELRTPFADLDVIRFSLVIPSEYKVKAGNDVTRKWILRSVAEGMGLPEDIVWRRKKGIQHGTGVENAIRELAKSRNLSVESYLARMHAEVRDLDSMP